MRFLRKAILVFSLGEKSNNTQGPISIAQWFACSGQAYATAFRTLLYSRVLGQ
jgi:hypothetical protein